jgi:uncharacterized protein YjbI with pentapeptide repeats
MLNYRKRNLDGISFSERDLLNSCFWGVSAKSADFSGSQLIKADCRIGDFSNALFIEADCKNANFSGAFLYRADFSNADLSGTIFSSPSIFTCSFTPKTCFHKTIYCHLGEENYWLSDLLEENKNLNRIFFDSKNYYLKTA